MALSITTQWTLVASGLMAHADQVMSGPECERLMALVDEAADGDDYAQWMSIISEPPRLKAMLDELPLPPPDSRRKILEDAWLMAVVDGQRVAAEVAVLERIAAQFEVEPVQLEFWREAWTTAQHAQAAAATAALGYVLGGGAPVLPEDESVVDAFVHALPTTNEHRGQLVAAGLVPQTLDDVERRLRALGRPQRRDLVRRLAGAVADARRADDARERWRALGHDLGLSDEELDRLA
jgi:Tellurite resistance protein TerB